MKKSSPFSNYFALLIASIPLVYLAYIYPDLSQTIPLHFDINGKADGFGDKSKLWIFNGFLSVMSIGVYFLIVNLPKIDPKKTAGQSPELFRKIAILLVVFLSALNLVILLSSQSGTVQMIKLLFPLMGLMFSVLGNYMHSIKPNYFVGFRTPWTLESEDNWRKTHQLVGKLWVPGGILITICTLIMPAKIGFLFFIAVMMVITIIPLVFSYRYFKQQQKQS